jgi:hypothetical protein
MKKILSFFIASSFFLLLTRTAFTQTKLPIEGVWKITKEVTPTGDSIINGEPQPSLLIFTKGYYSIVIVKLERPRAPVEPAKDPKNLTDSEKIARYEQWRPFAAIAGSYEIKGSILYIHTSVAKTVDLMNRQTPITWEFKTEGNNTLWLTPIGQSATEPKIKLTRLE